MHKHISCPSRICCHPGQNIFNFKKSYVIPLVPETLLIARKKKMALHHSFQTYLPFRNPGPNRPPRWQKEKELDFTF
jgi:hypothetical protein